jgi:hypothetical protein
MGVLCIMHELRSVIIDNINCLDMLTGIRYYRTLKAINIIDIILYWYIIARHNG